MAPAILYAEHGFVLQQGDVDMLAVATEDFRRDPAAAAIFLNHGEPYAAGARLVQADLAATLRRVSEEGARGFYQGPVAAALVAANRAGGGIITQADLDAYEARERAPVECDYRGFHVVSSPPPSAGGTVLCEMLEILEGYPLHELGFH
jgi:gamma-glutamyltranspeptidase/glutathione hydrolase